MALSRTTHRWMRAKTMARFLALFGLITATWWSITLRAEPPSWWAERGVTYSATVSSGDPSKVAKDYAAINKGQFKNLVKKAAEELRARAPGHDNQFFAIDQLVSSWSTPTPGASDYAPITLGEVKNVARLFYDVLVNISYIIPYEGYGYPWEGYEASANDYAIANIGQVKQLFSFDLKRPDPNDPNHVASWWKTWFFGPDPANFDPYGDPDGDGLMNYQEYLLGLDPTTPFLAIISSLSAQGTTGVPFSYQIVSNHSPTKYYAYPLPKGLHLNSATGLISGTPLEAGVFGNISLVAIQYFPDFEGNVSTKAKEVSFTLTIHATDPIITSPTMLTAIIGKSLTYQITTINQADNYSATSSLPPGLTFDNVNGRISGIPTATGSYQITLGATRTANDVSYFSTADLTVQVFDQLHIDTTVFAPARVGVPYDQPLVVSGNPAHVSVTGLPGGLHYNAQNGHIVGTPTVAGKRRVIITAYNLVGTIAKNLDLNVWAPVYDAEFIAQSSPDVMVPGQLANITVTMRNRGTLFWNTTDYHLCDVGAAVGQASCWNISQINLQNEVAPGAVASFSFSMTAPAKPGHYPFQWQMTRTQQSTAGLVGFGDKTAAKTIEVGANASVAGVLLNPGFEQPSLTTDHNSVIAPANAGWSFDGTAGVTLNGSADASFDVAAPEGTQAAFLRSTGAMSQTTASLQAGTYVVAFQAAQGAGNGNQEIDVSAGVVPLGSFKPSSGGYSHYRSAPLTVATDRTVTLKFAGSNSSSGNTALIDDVQIIPVASGGVSRGKEVKYPTSQILAVDFDDGGQDIAFGDNTSYNEYASIDEPQNIREGAVDIIPSLTVSGGYEIGSFEAGEYLNYTVSITHTGDYQLTVHTGSVDGGLLRVEVDGVDVSGALIVPAQHNLSTETNLLGPYILPLIADDQPHIVRLVGLKGKMQLAWFSLSEPMPDSWQQANLGGVGNDPNADPDGDGLTNLEEFLQGTNPKDYYNGNAPHLNRVSGGSQIGPPNTFLPLPLQVSVTTAGGTPLANAPVHFVVANNQGKLQAKAGEGPASTIDLRSDAQGQINAYMLLPAMTVLDIQITASASSATPVDFHETSAVVTGGGSGDGSGNGSGDSPFRISDPVAVLDANGNLDVSWSGENSLTTVGTPIYLKTIQGYWRLLTTAAPGENSVRLPPAQ